MTNHDVGIRARCIAGVVLAAVLMVSVAWAQSASPLGFDLAIEGGRMADGRKVVRVTQDDRVALRWSASEPVDVHLHGYDIKARVIPGEVTPMAFDAHATGRFPVAIHGADQHDKTILYVEVYPR